MDHIWKAIGFIGIEILDLCSSHPLPYHDYKDALAEEVPGALLGVAMLLVSIVCIIACVCCKERRNGFKEFRDSSHSLHQTGLAFTNPLTAAPASELSIFPPPGATPVTFEPLPSLASLSPRARRPPGCHSQLSAADLDDWFAKKDADFPRHQLQFLKDCGRGWFGRVVEGEARGFSDARYKVMVRMLREDATPAELKLFLGEVKHYRDLDHVNVLKLVGRCLETHPYLVLLEACSAGDLKSFLRSGNAEMVDQGVCLSIMCQVTEGLRHMINHGFVHTDLAARNCQVTSDMTVKVGDYGTSIETYKEEYYVAGDVAVPIRWCAPETLLCTDTTIETKQVTAAANMWSLGVLLWEVCQFGQTPYTDLTDDQVIVHVLGGNVRLPPPSRHPLHGAALHHLMTLCWGPPAARPPPDHVLAMLRHLRASRSDDDFQRRWDALKPGAQPEITLEAMTARSDFDSGVDLEIKSTDREVLDLVKKSLSDINITPGTSSPQLSVTSSGGEFFSQTSLPVLHKQQSPSMTNLHGSADDVSRPAAQGEKRGEGDVEEFDSWLQGVETTCEEDVRFVKKISEAIRDLDDALALEKTSSSSDDSRAVDFRLGPMVEGRRDSSETDTEDESWRGRIERGEFTEKVKEKSKSVTDLMILTHIESESETDSLPSLTRQYSVEKKKKFSGIGVGFGSEGNIRGAVLGEGFQDALKQLQAEWKLREPESRETSLQFLQSEQSHSELDFLSNEASEKPSTPQSPTTPASPPAIVKEKTVDDFQSLKKTASERVSEKLTCEVPVQVHSPETSESSANTESSSETSTPTQYEVVRSFVDAERAYATSNRANIVPNQPCVETVKNKTVESNCDSIPVAKSSVTDDSCLISEKTPNTSPSECLVVSDHLLSGVAKGDKVPEQGIHDVPLKVNDFLLSTDEKESSFVPEIVVTEASILDVESEPENQVVLPVTRSRRSIRLIVSSSDSESDDEKGDVTVSDVSEVRNIGVVTSTPFVRERKCESVDVSVSDVDPTFPETTLESCYVTEANSIPENNQVSSVILGSCEDYTLDYFKGLKTTFGKQTSDESTDEFSKSEDERDDEKSNWDDFLTKSRRYDSNSSDVERDDDLELNNKNREENSAFDYSDGDMDILKPKLKFDERFKDVEKNVMICDRLDIFDNLSGKHSQDQQMEEVKSRLEDVAKLSEGFCLRSTEEEDGEGKLLTPDDERSSDSGFRDKGSLSESVEDGCDDKYNLEDIDAELEPETTSAVGDRPTEGRREERLDKLDDALDSNIDHFFQAGGQKTGWYLHPPPGTEDNGWLPTAPEEDHQSVDISEEFVTAIRNELREKLPCAQNPERSENEEDVTPEEERTDLVIQYNTYPAPLSPIFEERESISSNQSSLLLDETGRSLDSSGKSSPIIYLESVKVDARFEEDIKSALDVCSSESTESDNVLVTVEDLEDSTEKAQKVRENPKEDMDDLLIVDMETNKVILYESPKPKSQLAFVKQAVEPEESPANSETYTCYHSADDNVLSVDRNNPTCTPDSCTLSPISTGSSRTGVAVSFSSSETGGNLSGFYLSPSSVRSDLFDSGPPSLPFDLGLIDIDRTVDVEPVEEIIPNNEAEEIVQELIEAGVIQEESEISYSNRSPEPTEDLETGKESSIETTEKSDSSDSDVTALVNGRVDPNVLDSSDEKKNIDCDKMDRLLSTENVRVRADDGQEWLKTVLLGSSLPEGNTSAATISLNPTQWPRAEELLPVVRCERVSPESPLSDTSELAQLYDVTSTLAISTPNNTSFDESKDNSQLSSFTSTPTVENKTFSSRPAERPDKSVPSLSSLANEIVLRFPPSEERKEVAYDSSPEESSERGERLRGMTLALESSVMSKAPMPSPEDADKGSWRPTMNQLMELTSQEAEDMMTTSFIDNDNDNDIYTPDWESDSSDDSEDRSSSSGEFIWRDGDKEEAVRVVIACDDLEPQDGASDRSMARISEGEEEEEEDDDEDSSSCGSTTEFVPSTWDRNATPTKSALRSAEKQKGLRRNVSFKRQKYHCVYEYPREPGSEDEGSAIQQPCWQTPDYSTYTDWEYGEGEVETEDEEEEEDATPRQLPESEYDFYRLSNLDFDTMTQMNLDDGEFFISSSARPFAMGNSSQFFPGGLGFGDDDFLVEFQPCAADTEALVIPSGHSSLDETVNTELREVVVQKTEAEKARAKPDDLQLTAEFSGESTPAEVSPTLGELRHTRERLKLDLGRASDSGGDDSGVGSADRLDDRSSGEADEARERQSREEKKGGDQVNGEDAMENRSDKTEGVDKRLSGFPEKEGEEKLKGFADELERVEEKMATRSSEKTGEIDERLLGFLEKKSEVRLKEFEDKMKRVEEKLAIRSSDKTGEIDERLLGFLKKKSEVRLKEFEDKMERVEEKLAIRSSDKTGEIDETLKFLEKEGVEERFKGADGLERDEKTMANRLNRKDGDDDRLLGIPEKKEGEERLKGADKLEREETITSALDEERVKESSVKLNRLDDDVECLRKLERERDDSGEDSGVGSSDKLDQVEPPSQRPQELSA